MDPFAKVVVNMKDTPKKGTVPQKNIFAANSYDITEKFKGFSPSLDVTKNFF